MRIPIMGMILLLTGAGCGALPPARPVCRAAGFRDAEVQALLPDIRAARDAGATREEVINDAAAACAACAASQPPCDQNACLECFTLLIDEVYRDGGGDADSGGSGG